jgi:hypothetical protein
MIARGILLKIAGLGLEKPQEPGKRVATASIAEGLKPRAVATAFAANIPRFFLACR